MTFTHILRVVLLLYVSPATLNVLTLQDGACLAVDTTQFHVLVKNYCTSGWQEYTISLFDHYTKRRPGGGGVGTITLFLGAKVEWVGTIAFHEPQF